MDAAGSEPALSHVDTRGHARMVDVSGKEPSHREAAAEAIVLFPEGVLGPVLAEPHPKGDLFGVARIAGIQGAKRTPDWIPLCHPLPLDKVEVDLAMAGDDRIRIVCTASATARTGVEMEAMVGAAAAAATLYDMCKSAAKGIVIERIRLLSKTGGKSGDWQAPGG